MKLSILDQSPIRKNSNAAEALKETTQLAKKAEEWGYHRFWVSEHHNTMALAGTSPEVLIAHLAAHTRHLRIGSGGVMLPHYSALKVAENFRLLESLYPGRIDLGMGRAPGGDRLTARILNPMNEFDPQEFVKQLYEIQHYLAGEPAPSDHTQKVRAMPMAPGIPEQWILSSSGESGIFAAHFGMHFAFAHFINPNGGPEAVRHYKETFRPSYQLEQPQTLVALFVFCSEDEETILRNKAVTQYRFIQLERGRFDPVSYEDLAGVIYTPAELQRLETHKERMIMGTPEEVEIKLLKLAKDYDSEEIMIVNIALNFEERIRSYELIANIFLH